MAKKERRATENLNVALSGISATLSIIKDVETVEEAKKVAAMAHEHIDAAWHAYGEIKKAADSI